MKYLVAFLNSKIFKSVLKINFPDLGEDRRELRKVFFEQIKIINPTNKAKDEIEKIVDVLRLQKEYGYNTTQLEQEIDRIIYQEYNLTVDEIALIDTWATI